MAKKIEMDLTVESLGRLPGFGPALKLDCNRGTPDACYISVPTMDALTGFSPMQKVRITVEVID